ncbi:hypothetical protein B0A54_08037 [Friedmanniomyces endolithicus]|uniref:Uncharacterized protein n=1 Tax=Friedmanniomyces endolithicus TaxID=329885 RepID=A0A4U0UX69_9PEZI|nr:hypothetical protein B0A54_08037 [Friedmanniomyces endolithicus]
MPIPGYIVHPDGQTHSVADKLTFFAQHPETLEPTRAAVAQHAAQRLLHAAVLGEEVAWSREVRRAKKVDLEGEEGYKHWRDGVEIEGLLCERCRGTKLVWSDCAVCIKEEEAEKVKAEKLAKGERDEKAAGDDVVTAGGEASPES